MTDLLWELVMIQTLRIRQEQEKKNPCPNVTYLNGLYELLRQFSTA